MSDTNLTPIFFLSVDGETDVSDITRRVISLEIDEHLKKATKITATLDDEDGAIASGDLLREGMTIGVRWGYAGAASAGAAGAGGGLSDARAAIVHKIEAGYADGTAKIEAFGRELALSRGAIRRTFRGRSFREALEQVCREATPPVTVRWEAGATGGVRLDSQVIDDEHAWAWILRQSTSLALDVEMVGGELTVRQPRAAEAPVTVLHYRWRNAEILSFDPETNGKKHRHESEGVVALFFDPATGEGMSHAAGDPTTTRATLAARRVRTDARREGGTGGSEAGEAAALAAYVRAHPELTGRSPADRQAAFDRSRAAQGQGGRAPTDDDAMLVNLAGAGDDGAGTAAGTAATPQGTAPSAPATVPVTVPAERHAARQHVAQLAEGRFRERERRRVKAKAVCLMLPRMTKGRVVQVVGVHPRDAGLWMVHGCTHKVTEGEMELELKRDGVNGSHGARQGAGARPNQQAGGTNGTQPGMQDALVPVALGDG